MHIRCRLPSAAVWLLRNHGFQNVKAVRHVYPEEAKSSEARSVYDCTPVTLNSEMDFYLRNGRNGDFFTKWSYKIQFYSLSGIIFYVNIKVRHAYHLIVLFKVF